MAALPYMQLYVADYLADTQHLTTEEHGAYLLLLFSYWQTGKALRSDRLAPVARLSNERWNDVKETLKEFFFEDGNQWIHFRVEADLEAVNSKSIKASGAGKASARARAARKQAALQGISTNVEHSHERIVNHTDTDTDTYTDTDTDTDTYTDTDTDTDTDTEHKKPMAKKVIKTDHFDRFWKLYPKKKSKADAEKAFAKLKMTEELFSVMISSLSTQAASRDWTKDGGQYVPMAGRWIREKRWEDETAPAQSRHNGFEQTDYMEGLTVEGDGTLRF